MQITMDCKLIIELETCSLKEILSAFRSVMIEILCKFVHTALCCFTEKELDKPQSAFICHKCGSCTDFHWKTHKGKMTSLTTEFGEIKFPELQLYCGCCGARKVISRELLGVERNARIPLETVRKLGLMGSLTTFRVSEKIASLFGVVLNKMTIWRCVQKTGVSIDFGIDPDECNVGEADGTGIAINGIKKRGREIKVFLQHKKGGGCRIANVDIGKYESGWNKFFKPLKKQIAAFEKFMLITDGDTSILKGLGKKLTIIFQRCLWHIPHQFKWTGWKDGVKKKSSEWITAIATLIDIVDVSHLHIDDEKLVKERVALKKEALEKLIALCTQREWKACATYLENAKNDLFRGVENKLRGKTSSHAERVMRTTKLRTRVGKWNEKSALNAIKIRLAYYYNGWDA